MTEPTKVPVKTERSPAPALQAWRPFETLRREIDRLFEDFDGGFRRGRQAVRCLTLHPSGVASSPGPQRRQLIS